MAFEKLRYNCKIYYIYVFISAGSWLWYCQSTQKVFVSKAVCIHIEYCSLCLHVHDAYVISLPHTRGTAVESESFGHQNCCSWPMKHLLMYQTS